MDEPSAFDSERIPSWGRDYDELKHNVLALIKRCREEQLPPDHDQVTATEVADLVMRQRRDNVVRFRELLQEAVDAGEPPEEATVRMFRQWITETRDYMDARAHGR